MRLLLFISMCACAVSAAPRESYSFDASQSFLKTYCQSCHDGKAAAGGFHLQKLNTPGSLGTDPQKWSSAVTRVKNGEMPPKGAPAPALEKREAFTDWVSTTLRTEACAIGVAPGPAPIRRLNRSEYTATIRDLLDINMDIGHSLPADSAGGEGFDNAAETLFLSPIHSEKYLEAAKFALGFASTEARSRAKILGVKPDNTHSPEEAAHRNLEAFLPLAFRRPVSEADLAPYLDLFRAAQKAGEPFDASMLFALRGVLVSPRFLFRVEAPNTHSESRPIDDYALASRLSYFLWGSMPDELLFDIAAAGKLHDPDILKEQVRRMLRHDKSLEFVRSFTEQWLRTRELGTEKVPDPKLFPGYAASDELRADIRYQPVLFFREILLKNLSLLNLLESKFTIATKKLSDFYDLKVEVKKNTSQMPQRVDLPENSDRGGLLGMPAVLAVSSYPYRSSPVLRGAWVLDSILGTPPPPPPPNVPALEEEGKSGASKSVRERLAAHRANAVCASCHSRIDPIGFALDNYDAIGRWRSEDAGKAIDTSGELPDGTKIDGPRQLKSVLLDRKDLFLRNLTSKMLGYALGRGLTLKDSCAVDNILAELKDNDYSAATLIESIVMSMPFRYQAPKTEEPTKP